MGRPRRGTLKRAVGDLKRVTDTYQSEVDIYQQVLAKNHHPYSPIPWPESVPASRLPLQLGPLDQGRVARLEVRGPVPKAPLHADADPVHGVVLLQRGDKL